LQNTAAAARQKYREIKTGPLPIIADVTTCPGSPVLLSSQGGGKFNFYSDAAGQNLVGTGSTFTTPPITTAANYYISNMDSLFESALVPINIVLVKPVVQFSFAPNPVPVSAKGIVTFTDETPLARQWHWSFGNGTHSNESNPKVKYTQPGQYQVKLVVTNLDGCVDSLTQMVEVKYTDYLPTWTEKDIGIFPNPTPGLLHINLSEGIDQTAGIQIMVIDPIGRTVLQTTTYQTGLQQLNLGKLANGLYFVKIVGKHGSMVRRVEVQRK
jgi:PKD repeat protein